MARLKTKSLSGGKWLVIIGLVAIVIVAGFIMYNRYSTAANKRAFQNARQTIDNVFYDAMKEVGQPDDAKITSNCSRTYKEFSGYGNLTCHVDTSFIYGVEDQDKANTIFRKIQSNIGSKYKDMKPTRPLAGSIKDSIVVSSTYHVATDIYKAYGLGCTVNYIYDTPREIDLKIKDKSKKPFEVTLGCYGPAKQQYFRLAS